MTPTSHRRCQFKGEGCTGMAHAGFDQCAHCYYQFVKPALKAERDEMKRRRQLKRLHLWPETRAQISAVDLDEPQMLKEPSVKTVDYAISEVLINAEIDLAIANEKDPIDYAGKMLTRQVLDDIPLPLVRPTAARAEEKALTPMPPTKAPAFRLTDETKLELGRLYEEGLSYSEIAKRTGANPYHINLAANELGLPKRGRSSDKKEVAHMPTPPASQTHVEPAPSNGVVSGLTEWLVTYQVRRTETKIMAAKTFNDAAFLVTESVDGDVEVIGVAKVLP